jgi:ketosteroid isomerase-like protein
VTQQNLEIVRSLVAALNARDVDAMVGDFYAPDAEFVPAMQGALEGTVYRGSDEIRAYYDEIYAVWDQLRVDLDDVRQSGDTVFATGSVTLRGKTSGVELVRPWAFVFELAAGRVCRQRNFIDRDGALEAAGLEG